MDPRAPQLALPSLAAYLRNAGVTVTMRDLALEGVLHLTEPAMLTRAMHGLAQQPNQPLIRPFERAAELAPWAVRALRDPEAFYDARDWNAAREVLSCVVSAHAAAKHPSLVCDLHPITYRIAGKSSARIRELIEITADPQLDLFHAFTHERLIPELHALSPDLVGITLTNHQQWLPGLSLARALKAHGFFVVLGGALISKFVDGLRATPDFFRVFADAVVAFEGETALLALLEELRGGRQLSRVPNLIYLERGFVRMTRTHVEDVSTLPTPDFEGLPLNSYLTPSPVLPVLTGKGCYFNRCKFCDIPFINHVADKPYRLRKPEQVVHDVRTLRERHGAEHFVITDEALSPKLLLKLADAFEPYAHEPRSFTGYARLEDGFTAEVLERVSAMGIRKLYFGMESASQVMVDHMDKGTTSASTVPILQRCVDAGIRFHVFSIIGLPEETEAMARETYQFFIDNQRVLGHPGSSFGIRRFSLELRTDYFENRARYGIEIDPSALEGEFLVGIDPEHWDNSRGLTGEQVEELLRDHFNPGLVEAYRSLMGAKMQIWPVGEEHAVLYCARYRGSSSSYPYGACLPALDSPAPISLRTNPAAASRKIGDIVELVLPGRSVPFPSELLELLTTGEPSSVAALLGRFPDADPVEVMRGVDFLISAGLLQMRTELSNGSAN
jgi:anaerobic magnesium-protoporphyrin IX monomethyl ester cyclase